MGSGRWLAGSVGGLKRLGMARETALLADSWYPFTATGSTVPIALPYDAPCEETDPQGPPM